MNRVMEVLFILLAIVCAISFIVSQPLLGSCVVGFAFWVFWSTYVQKIYDLKFRGFHVEYVSEGILRADKGQFEIIYHEGVAPERESRLME